MKGDHKLSFVFQLGANCMPRLCTVPATHLYVFYKVCEQCTKTSHYPWDNLSQHCPNFWTSVAGAQVLHQGMGFSGQEELLSLSNPGGVSDAPSSPNSGVMYVAYTELSAGPWVSYLYNHFHNCLNLFEMEPNFCSQNKKSCQSYFFFLPLGGMCCTAVI